MPIDFHTHCYPDALAPKALDAVSYPAASDGTLNGLKQSMRKVGVGLSITLHVAKTPRSQRDVNNFAISIQDESIISFGSVHPFSPDAPSELDRLYSAGIRGVKLHPQIQRFFADDPACLPLYEKIAELGMITLFHCGVSSTGSGYACYPRRMEKIIPYFSGAPVICAHMGGISADNDELCALRRLPVYIDTSFSSSRLSPERFLYILELLGADRILFGSDTPWSAQERELDFVKRLVSDKRALDMILSENAKKLLDAVL